MSLIESTKKIVVQFKRRRRFDTLTEEGLPSVVGPAIRYLLDGKIVEPEISTLIHKIESIRNDIAAGGDTPIEIFYSPKPGSSGGRVARDLRPAPGEVLQFTMRQVARTGKDKKWGTFLHLCARSAQSETILELGSCVGISGCYLSSSPYCREFITVEGSAPLAKIAEHSLRQMGDNAVVYNKLFDDALDEILPQLEEVDFAFIDGHHEKVATIHYFERVSSKLSPGALVVFDDISWSYDMRECWEYLAQEVGFTDAVDCGVLGICFWNPSITSPTKYWNLQEVLGRQAIGDPHGWKS
jgi:predicted O-methyltransferase YrrM